MDEMRLAATGRTMQDQSRRRPIGPSIDPLDGRNVAVGNHKIRSPESCAVGQVESQLDHSKRIPARSFEEVDCAGQIARVRRAFTRPAPSAQVYASNARGRTTPTLSSSKQPPGSRQ